MHYKNQLIFNFESRREQVFSQAQEEHSEKLVLLRGEDITRKERFQIFVETKITPVDGIEVITCVDTVPYGHVVLHMIENNY